MQQLIYFFRKFKYFLFFLMLQFIALALTFNNLNFHKSKYVNSANSITGGFYAKSSAISDYLNLKSENKILIEENTVLKNRLEKNKFPTSNINAQLVDSSNYNQKYIYTGARITKNSYSTSFNYLTINKGKNDGIEQEMAVINSKGIIGITDNTSQNYARVQSILNRNSKINARLKNKDFYFGTLSWDGIDYNIVQLRDLPKQAPIKIGDTIETGGKSTIFPEGILIGEVVKVYERNSTDTKIDVKLFNDMSNIGPVYIVKNLHQKEIQSLELLDNE